jgi:hypothetical protein
LLVDIHSYRECQKHGLWAYDAEYKELVLVVPSVLAMLGDNPMQSEFTCHIGFRGKFFCRVCWVKGEPEEPEGNEEDTEGEGLSDASNSSTADGKKKKKKTKKKDESVDEMISRITQFMSVSEFAVVPIC